MNTQAPEVVTEGINILVQPYLGKREYGRLYITRNEGLPPILPHSETNEEIMWRLGYEHIFGSSRAIDIEYQKSTGIFSFMDIDENEITTQDPLKAIDNVRRWINNIKPQREKDLRDNAIYEKRIGTSLEQAIEDIKTFARERPEFGPTDEEINLYEIFAQEVFNS